MRKLKVDTYLTLDGVMQAPGGPDEDTSGGFTHGGWSVKYWDQRMNDLLRAVMGKPFDLLLGRRTYEIFAAYWPRAVDQPAAAPLNNATKYVASFATEPNQEEIDQRREVLQEGATADHAS